MSLSRGSFLTTNITFFYRPNLIWLVLRTRRAQGKARRLFLDHHPVSKILIKQLKLLHVCVARKFRIHNFLFNAREIIIKLLKIFIV